MKKKFLLATILLSLLLIFLAGIAISGRIYPETMIVCEIDLQADVVTLETATGLLYQYAGVEDADIGDLEALIMFNAGNKKYVTDDVILSHRYAGYIELFEN